MDRLASTVLETSRIIFEDFESDTVVPAEIDRLLAHGWRHAGTHFYRYNFAFHRGILTEVIPLRIVLDEFAASKSQRRNCRTNEGNGYRVIIRPSVIDQEKNALFQQHKCKFEDNVPESLHDFLSPTPSQVPCEGGEIAVYDGDQLISVSFFDIGAESLSTIYGMYDLDYSKQGLGIYTMLLEMEHARQLGKRYYYHGYCYRCPSFYDYKKAFKAVEAFNWEGQWTPLNPSD
ncbi:MAG: arginyl-tRNA--protein-N-Asp/Glu arginylyltransferase [Verrucomicrobiales bacterium]|jgi:arginyl-tRNA--protein-N-Asp/Glu arginylyltransferase